MPHGSNRLAVERMVHGLEAVSDDLAPLVESVRSLADQVDDEGFDDKAWREYRLALKALREASLDGGSDEFADFLADATAEVRNRSDS